MGRKKKQRSASNRPKHGKGLGQSESHQGLGLASMPLPWLESVASCLRWSRLPVFRTCKDMAAVLLGHLGYTAGLSMDRVALQHQARTRRQVHHHQLMEQAAGFAAAHGNQVALSMFQGVTARRVDYTAWSTVLTRASSLAGLESQQLCAITSVSCGGTSKAPWVLQGSLIPEALVNLCPNLRTLRLWDVRVGSLPEPAAACLAPCAKLERLEVEALTFADPTSSAMMSYQASRFPALTALSLPQKVTRQADTEALAGLVTALASQLTYLEPPSTWSSHSLFFPAGIIYPKLQQLKSGFYGIPVQVPQALPAITHLYLDCMDLQDLSRVPLPWLQQLCSVSCNMFNLQPYNEPTDASMIADRLQACGGIHIKPKLGGHPILVLDGLFELACQLLPHVHCTGKDLVVVNWYELSREEVAALGEQFKQCSYVRFNVGMEPSAMRELPQLMPGAQIIVFVTWDSIDMGPFLDMCRTATRHINIWMYDALNVVKILHHVAEFVRAVCPESKVCIGWEEKVPL